MASRAPFLPETPSHAETPSPPSETHHCSLSSPACLSGDCLLLRSSVVTTTAMPLVRASGSNPGLSSFLGQRWARGLNAVGVGKARTRQTDALAHGGSRT